MILENIAAEKKQEKQWEQTVKVFSEAKTRVQAIVNGLKKLEKKTKKTKKSRRAVKIMEDFIKCNITSPAIVDKYERVVEELKQYSSFGDKDENQG